LFLRVSFPQLGNSSSPVIDIQENNVLILVNVYFFTINGHGEKLRKSHGTFFENIDGANLSIDKFVAELGKEQLWIFLTNIMKILAYFGIKANTYIVIDGKLSVLFSAYCHFPTIQ